MTIKYEVSLTEEQKEELLGISNDGHYCSQKMKRAHVLWLANERASNSRIAHTTGLSISTVFLITKRFADSGFEFALCGKRKSGVPLKFTQKDEANLLALARKPTPDGFLRRSYRNLAKEFVTEAGAHLSHETVRKILVKNNVAPWRVMLARD